MEDVGLKEVADSITKQNTGIHIDLNLIPLKNQVNAIWLTKVITNNQLLEKITGISKTYIEYIVDHQEEILKRWSRSLGRQAEQETEEDKNEHAALNHILMQWAKRMFWNGYRAIEPSDIEEKANELRRCLFVSNYWISSKLWEELIAFKLKEIDNYIEHTQYPLGTLEILRDSKKHISAETYKKFLERLTCSVSMTNSIKHNHEIAATTASIDDVTVDDDAESGFDNDVILIEEPIECIDVDMDNDNDDNNAEITSDTGENGHTVKDNGGKSDTLRDALSSIESYNGETIIGRPKIKAEPELSDIEEDILHIQNTLDCTNDDSTTYNDTLLYKTVWGCIDSVDRASLVPALKTVAKKSCEAEKANDNSEDENVEESMAADEGETYIDIIADEDDMHLTEISQQSTATEEFQKSSEGNDDAPKLKRKTTKSKLKAKHKTKRNPVPNATEILKNYQQRHGICTNSTESSGEESYDDEYIKSINFADVLEGANELEMPQNSRVTDGSQLATKNYYCNSDTAEEDELHDHALLDNLIFEWSKRYILNRMKPDLKPYHIIDKAITLKTKLKLPRYCVNVQLWKDIFAYKAKKIFRRHINVKLNMDIVKILRESDFNAPSKTHFKFINILKNRLAAGSKLRTYTGKSKDKTQGQNKTEEIASLSESERHQIVKSDDEPTNGVGNIKSNNFRKSGVKSKTETKKRNNENASLTDSVRTTDSSRSTSGDTALRTYGGPLKAKINHKPDNIHEQHSRSIHNVASTSTDYDILQKDFPTLKTLNEVQKPMSNNSTDLQVKQFPRLSSSHLKFYKNVENKKESHKKEFDVEDELCLLNTREDFETLPENVCSDTRTGVIYEITELLDKEADLEGKETEGRVENTLVNDDTLLFAEADIKMIAASMDDNGFEPVLNIKQEILEDNLKLSREQLRENEEEFISCKSILKDVKQEQIEEGLKGSNIRNDENDELNEICNEPTSRDLKNLNDTKSKDDGGVTYKVPLKERLANLYDLKSEKIYNTLFEDDVINVDIMENENDKDDGKVPHNSIIPKEKQNDSQVDLRENEYVEVLQIIGGENDEEDGDKIEQTSQPSSTVKQELYEEDIDDETSQDSIDSFNPELDNAKALRTNPPATYSKRKTEMPTFANQFKRRCLETEATAEENLCQIQMPTNEIEAGEELSEFHEEEEGYDNDQDDEESITILDIISEAEDEDHENLEITLQDKPIKSKTFKKFHNSNRFRQSQTSVKRDGTVLTPQAKRIKSQSVSTANRKDQPTLVTATEAVDSLIKLKEFFRQRNHQIGLQLVLNLEMNFIYHDF